MLARCALRMARSLRAGPTARPSSQKKRECNFLIMPRPGIEPGLEVPERCRTGSPKAGQSRYPHFIKAFPPVAGFDRGGLRPLSTPVRARSGHGFLFTEYFSYKLF